MTPRALTVTSMRDPVTDSTANDGLTLRQAIETANARGGETTIIFNLKDQPSKVITLNAPLPPICACP